MNYDLENQIREFIYYENMHMKIESDGHGGTTRITFLFVYILFCFNAHPYTPCFNFWMPTIHHVLTMVFSPSGMETWNVQKN